MEKGPAVSLDSAVSALLPNKRRVSALKSLGITTVGEALTYYPFRVSEPVPVLPIRSVRLGSPVAFAARVKWARVVPMGSKRGLRLDVLVSDEDFAASCGVASSSARLVFFSHRKSYIDWMSLRLRPGARVVLAGEPSVFNGQLQFTHPDVLLLPEAGGGEGGADPLPGSIRPDADSQEQALAKVSRPRPVYHANSRISSDHIHDAILGFIRLLARAHGGGTALGEQAQGATLGTAQSASQGQPFEGEMEPAIDAEAFGRAVPDILPESARVNGHYLHRAQAFLGMHDPGAVEDFREALRTLRFEEAFVSQTALLRSREDSRRVRAYPCPQPGQDSLVTRFVDSLPFRLTQGQEEVIGRIGGDMARDYPMQRLLQGEVGSGKTVVALAAMLQAVDAGFQAVLVAPTQVLAEQHFESIGRMLQALAASGPAASAGTEPSGGADASEGQSKPEHVNEAGQVPLVLLTGGMRLAERRRALAIPASGRPCIVVATHAAFSKTFQAPHLALAVIDEQHRFGVEQREALRRKSERSPHLLVMTATPIPRTAAMTWFGDLDISSLTELPGGRKPIRTFVVPEADGPTMAAMFLHIRERVQAGERAYIVCPRIDEDEEGAQTGSGAKRKGSARRSAEGDLPEIDPYAQADAEGAEPKPRLHSVEEMSHRLAALPQFQGISMATLTGRDDDETKNQVMADFSSGKTQVLVSTTVIEVGVDVPQASQIVIFDADRFGLSQLHQLRGRVGRGGTDSWAFLVSRAESDSLAAQRLEVIRASTDGAEIAQADIEMRGAGDVLGDAQSGGRSSLKLLRVVKDAKMIAQAREQAEGLLKQDPELKGHVELAGAALDFTRGNETFLTST